MDQRVLAVHFGEPPEPDPTIVRSYLTAIFLQNADLGDPETDEEAREQAATLAARRAPGLIEEYEAIGGSPMNAQATDQVAALETKLEQRGHECGVDLAFQFLEPSIESQIQTYADQDIDRLIVLPIYPLCGPSTTVAALERTQDAVEGYPDWTTDIVPVSGWHRHPDYLRLRCDMIREFVDEQTYTLTDPSTELIFSAHGTPTHYLQAGSRYQMYVEEFCETLAKLLGGIDYQLGYQNHENRDIPWTEPDVESLVEEVDADRIVVDPVSFMHEQSETLSELDIELAEEATDNGIEFHRVPVPHDDPRFPSVLLDVIEPFVTDSDPAMYQLRSCDCAATTDAWCLNAPGR